MSRYVSQLRKYAEGRGTGHGADYIPWIRIDEFNSMGTCSGYPDPIHGRAVQLLSQGELKAYALLRWNDNVIDIREQFPLPMYGTFAIARAEGIDHPVRSGEIQVMTTDLLVDLKNGGHVAVSCKPDANKLSERDKEKIRIEELYWEKAGTKFVLVETNRIPKLLANNILDVFQYYDESKVHDSFSKAKHLVATKELMVNMAEVIDWKAVIRGNNL